MVKIKNVKLVHNNQQIIEVLNVTPRFSLVLFLIIFICVCMCLYVINWFGVYFGGNY